MALAATAKPGVEQPYAIHADLAHLAHDQDLTAKIMRKRQEEMARRMKLLDPRKRQFGVEHQVLDEQVAVKREAADLEAAEDVYHAAAQRTQCEVLQHLEVMKQQVTRERQKATIDFSMANLGKEQRREYALSDPSVLRNERMMTDEEVAQLGPSAMQTFEGQKMGSIEYKKQMQADMKEYLEMQMREKEAKAIAEKEWHMKMDQQLLLSNDVRGVCERAEKEEAHTDKLEEAAANKILAQQQAEQKQARLRREYEETVKHAETVAHQAKMRLVDDYKIASNGKLVRTEYRRLTIEEEQDVYNQNAQLVLEKRMRKQQEAAEDLEHAKQIAGTVAVLGAVESLRAGQSKERQLRNTAHNQELAATKREEQTQERRRYMAHEHIP